MTSTLLAKDTSHRTVFPVFSAGGGMGLDEMEGAGNFVMVADPATFRVLPWADNTGWMLCDIYFPNGKPVPFSTRALYRDALGAARQGRLRFLRRARGRIPTVQAASIRSSRPTTLTWPAEAPAVEHTTHGFQYLDRGAVRSGRSDPRNAAQDRAGARHAAASRSRSSSARASTSSPSRRETGMARGRHHGAVSQRHEAGGAAARLSRQLHVPAAAAQHASPAAGICISRCSIANRARTCSSPATRAELLSPLGRHFLAGLHRACARRGGVHHADRQRLQALSRRQLDGADPGGLGAGTIAA